MSTTVARRYASALYEQANQNNDLEQIDQDVALLRESLEASDDLRRFFLDPILNVDQKTRVVDALLGSRIHGTTINFVRLLINKRREVLIEDILSAFQTLRDKHMGILEATARVAIEIDAAEEQRLVQALEKMTGQKIRLNTVIDKSLIAGLIIKVGDTVYDGSVRHKLALLSDKLSLSTLSNN